MSISHPDKLDPVGELQAYLDHLSYRLGSAALTSLGETDKVITRESGRPEHALSGAQLVELRQAYDICAGLLPTDAPSADSRIAGKVPGHALEASIFVEYKPGTPPVIITAIPDSREPGILNGARYEVHPDTNVVEGRQVRGRRSADITIEGKRVSFRETPESKDAANDPTRMVPSEAMPQYLANLAAVLATEDIQWSHRTPATGRAALPAATPGVIDGSVQ